MGKNQKHGGKGFRKDYDDDDKKFYSGWGNEKAMKNTTIPTIGQSVSTVSNMMDEEFQCIECGNKYVITANQKAWFMEKGFAIPKRCDKCRKAKKDKRSAPIDIIKVIDQLISGMGKDDRAYEISFNDGTSKSVVDREYVTNSLESIKRLISDNNAPFYKKD